MQPDPLMVRGLAGRYGSADKEIRKLLEAMTAVRSSSGKKTMFGGDRYEAAVKAFLRQLHKTCAVLVEMKLLDPTGKKSSSLSALNSILASYRLVYLQNPEAFAVWDDFFRYQVTVEPDSTWLRQVL